MDASLDSPLSRWLWIVKVVLLVPHYVVLALLWLAFTLLSVVAFFGILFTGYYPRAIFEFNVGVLRWTWRVDYYAIGAFGTDRYPPFTLADVPGYPAHLEIDYPGRLSRGLVLVKWWLLAIPHYIVVGVFTGAGLWFVWRAGEIGLIGILVLFAAIVLLFTGRYPREIFDFVLGMNRWGLRVAAYAGLMTDEYPPFRLDMGGHEPGGTIAIPPSQGPGHETPPAWGAPVSLAAAGGQPPAGQGGPQEGPGEVGPPPPQQPPGPAGPQQPPGPAGPQWPPGAAAGFPQAPGPAGPRQKGWTTGRIVSVVAGSVLVLVSLGLLGAGGAALWADTAARHGDYVDLGTASYSTAGYAVASEEVQFHASGNGWDAATALLGNVRIRVTPENAATPVFVGVANADAANRYLAGVGYVTVRGSSDQHGLYTVHSGTAPATRPTLARIWTAQASGPGTQTLIWPAESGHWMVVAMNADGSRPVSIRVNIAATLPALPWIATGFLVAGVVVLVGAVFLIVVPVRRASR